MKKAALNVKETAKIKSFYILVKKTCNLFESLILFIPL